MQRTSLLAGLSTGLLALSPVAARVTPYFVRVPVSQAALDADPSLANYITWDIRISVTTSPGATGPDRFNVATFDSLLETGNFYSPVGGGDLPVVPDPLNLAHDTYVTFPGYVPGTNSDHIFVLGSSDLLGPGTQTAIFPRAGEQQHRLSVAWGALQNALYNGDYSIAQFTVSTDASGPLMGYVLSNQVNNLFEDNLAIMSFSNGMLLASPGSEFALLADANRDNAVDTTDFNAVAGSFNQLDSTWSQGDFNGDGITNALDFNALAYNYGSSPSTALGLGQAVPEPASLTLLPAATLTLRRRRP